MRHRPADAPALGQTDPDRRITKHATAFATESRDKRGASTSIAKYSDRLCRGFGLSMVPCDTIGLTTIFDHVMSRLVVVSNRTADPRKFAAGGLAVARKTKP